MIWCSLRLLKHIYSSMANVGFYLMGQKRHSSSIEGEDEEELSLGAPTQSVQCSKINEKQTHAQYPNLMQPICKYLAHGGSETKSLHLPPTVAIDSKLTRIILSYRYQIRSAG